MDILQQKIGLKSTAHVCDVPRLVTKLKQKREKSVAETKREKSIKERWHVGSQLVHSSQQVVTEADLGCRGEQGGHQARHGHVQRRRQRWIKLKAGGKVDRMLVKKSEHCFCTLLGDVVVPEKISQHCDAIVSYKSFPG